jgi:hypothetical protein
MLRRNIRHAFFQPAENEMMTLLHFHLNDPIMVRSSQPPSAFNISSLPHQINILSSPACTCSNIASLYYDGLSTLWPPLAGCGIKVSTMPTVDWVLRGSGENNKG